MRTAAIQMPIRMDVAANLRDLRAAIASLAPGTLAVAPEGCLSGYLPQPGLTAHLDATQITEAIEAAREITVAAGLHLVVGACVKVDEVWRNASFYMGPQRELWRYDKINLAMSERDDFTPGDELPVLDICIDGRPVRLGVQMCREIKYPEQWRCLAQQGADVIAYVNNTVGKPEGPDLWRAHVISRAAEIQRFVIGANNAAPDQGCTTLIVAPSGKVLGEAPMGELFTATADVELTEVSNWIIGQARGDVVAVENLRQAR